MTAEKSDGLHVVITRAAPHSVYLAELFDGNNYRLDNITCVTLRGAKHWAARKLKAYRKHRGEITQWEIR